MNHESLVRTKELEFSYNSGKFSFEEALGKLMVQLMPYSVSVEVASVERRDPAGWPWLRLCGPRTGVEHALWVGWNAGMGEDERSDFVASMIEESYVSISLCPRCREAFPSDSIHVCWEGEMCEVCGSRSINGKGELLHYEEDCFK
jgi:hypothetical protein